MDDRRPLGHRSGHASVTGTPYSDLLAGPSRRRWCSPWGGTETRGTDDSMAMTWTTSAETARRMSRQRRRDTQPELALRSLLHAAGHRFRVAYPVPGLRRCSIDVAFPRRKLAVFVDGCFWHGCGEHGTHPKTNADRWAAKLESNRQRDRRVDQHLRDQGWTVVRVWEHEDPHAAADRVRGLLACVPSVRL